MELIKLETVKIDILRKMAIQQGYVQSECKLNGELIMAFVNDGKNPCHGCNVGIVQNCKSQETVPSKNLYIDNSVLD